VFRKNVRYDIVILKYNTYMSTISVPLSKEHEEKLDHLVGAGVASTRAGVMRKALEKLAEDAAVEAVLRAEREPSLKGDLDDLLKRI